MLGINMRSLNKLKLEDVELADCVKDIPNFTSAKVVKCYDGDTVTLAVLSPDETLAYKYSVRLMGVDTPELRGPKADAENAQKARDYVSSLILGKIVNVKLESKYDKYGRLLATIYAPGVSELEGNVAKLLIYNKLGKEYSC
tara:strand:+ start:129 stop:554 length:426 start_codon:yes stop_codon:yes gene_type:complete